MINLLPPAAKRNFTAGRVNALLVRYIWISVALLGLLASLCVFVLIMLQSVKATAEQQITSNDKSVIQLESVQRRADTFRANLAISKAILDQQTHYTDTLLKISGLMTKGTALSSLSLDQTTYGTPMTLQIAATDEQSALNLKLSFQESNLFSDVHFQSIAIGSDTNTPQASRYPVTAQLVVTINKAGI